MKFINNSKDYFDLISYANKKLIIEYKNEVKEVSEKIKQDISIYLSRKPENIKDFRTKFNMEIIDFHKQYIEKIPTKYRTGIGDFLLSSKLEEIYKDLYRHPLNLYYKAELQNSQNI